MNNTIIALSTIGILGTLNLFFNPKKNTRTLSDKKKIKIINNKIKLTDKELNKLGLEVNKLKKQKSKLWNKHRCIFLEENISKLENKKTKLECENLELSQIKNDLIKSLNCGDSKQRNSNLDQSKQEGYNPDFVNYLNKLYDFEKKPELAIFLNELYIVSEIFIYILNSKNYFKYYDDKQELEGFYSTYYTKPNINGVDFITPFEQKYLDFDISLNSPDKFYDEFMSKLQNLFNSLSNDDYEFIKSFIKSWKIILTNYLKPYQNLSNDEINNIYEITEKNYKSVKDKNGNVISLIGNRELPEYFKSVNPVLFSD